MTNKAPIVFSREMQPYSVAGYLLNIATLTLTIDRYAWMEKPFAAQVMCGTRTEHERFDTQESAIKWLRSTSSRIMRECLEVANYDNR